MRIERLRVAELRQFRAPFELAGLEAGLNIIGGPNEAGKSTLVRAIRAAFFERHRSTSVDDLRPHGDSAASPRIELDFELGGTACRLTKSFLQKKRCELVYGARRFEGVEAEDFLAGLLGFQFALKGASRQEHWGVPGLLWIEQGAGQELREAVLHAADPLRQALDDSLGEVAASGGDDLVAQVRRWREELLTSTGKPRAAYQKALDDEAALAQDVDLLRQQVEAYRAQVDELRRLRDSHAADEAARPWQALREQLAQAQQALLAAEALAGERDRVAASRRQALELRDLLRQQLAAADQRAQDLAARESALTAAALAHDQAAAVEAEALRAESQAALRLRQAREARADARRADTRATLARQLADATARARELAELLQRATVEHERATRLEREAAGLQIDPADLDALRSRSARLHELRIRQAAVATRLGFELDARAVVTIAGEPVGGRGELQLIAPTTVTIEGVGALRISPGGSDLAALADERSDLEQAQAALLQRLGADAVGAVEARVQAHARLAAEARLARQAARLLAPRGLDAIEAEQASALARQAEAGQALSGLPEAVADSTAGLPLAAAEQEHDACREAADDAARRLQLAREALAASASRLDSARQERDAQRTAFDDPAARTMLDAQRVALVDANARIGALEAALADIDTRIAAARPDILRQDVERLGRSVEQAERQHQERDRQIVQLTALLSAAGAQGLEEQWAQQQGAWRQAQRRREELQRRAEALDLLLDRLEQRRRALTQRLQAPLQRRLDHYLPLLMPAGRLEVDEHLVPGALTRPGPQGPEVAGFDSLSFGAREQMGLVSRLAYADLLQAAGRPTLIILDDALVHSDEQRLARMKRVLFDAASRHQVLLFTCHPGRWRDMGVAIRTLERR